MGLHKGTPLKWNGALHCTSDARIATRTPRTEHRRNKAQMQIPVHVVQRDYKAEVNELLKKSDAVQAEGNEIDISAAAQKALESVAAKELAARERGKEDSERARQKISQAQERFKAGAEAQGINLDDEFESDEPAPRKPSTTTNKYSAIMEQRARIQQEGKSRSGLVNSG